MGNTGNPTLRNGKQIWDYDDGEDPEKNMKAMTATMLVMYRDDDGDDNAHNDDDDADDDHDKNDCDDDNKHDDDGDDDGHSRW